MSRLKSKRIAASPSHPVFQGMMKVSAAMKSSTRFHFFLMVVLKAMHKTWISAALAPALALLASPLWAQQRTPTTVVACSGTFAKDSSHLELVTAFKSKNITFTDVEAADGTKVPASILFPNDPKRRLEVWWSNRTTRSDIHLIVIGGQSTWTAPGGMRLGQTLEQVEKINHK